MFQKKHMVSGNRRSMKDESNQPPRRIRVYAELSVDDVERITQAFAEGKLKELGVTNLVIGAPEVNPATNAFTDREDAREGPKEKGR
jgi:hypothetical protein